MSVSKVLLRHEHGPMSRFLAQTFTVVAKKSIHSYKLASILNFSLITYEQTEGMVSIFRYC